MAAIFDNDHVKRGLTYLFLNVGIAIFAAVIFIKIDMMTKTMESQTQEFSAQISWQGYLYHKAILNVLSREDANKEGQAGL